MTGGNSYWRGRIILIFLIGFIMFAYADTQQTTLTWVIPSNVSHTLSYGGSCSTSAMYFIESNSPEDPDIDGNGSKILPYDAATAGAACQSDAAAAITVENQGNVAIDVNADINTTLQTGVTLKGWLGSDTTFCGTSGLGGWEATCSKTGAGDSTVPTTTACASIGNTTKQVIAGLLAGDTNHLCLAADFAGMSFGTTTDNLRTTGS